MSNNLKNDLKHWLALSSYNEGLLVDRVPMKALTIQRIASGHYEPSAMLGNAIQAIMDKYPEGFQPVHPLIQEILDKHLRKAAK